MAAGTHHGGIRVAVLVVAVAALSAACVSTPEWYRKYQQPYRAHPELDRRAKTMRVVGLLPPDIKIYELTAGGVTELRDEWSAAGREAVVQGLTEAFTARGIALKPLVMDKDTQRSVDDVSVLYRAVSSSIIEHTYKPHPFTAKLERFDYSVGSLDALLGRSQADAAVIVYGVDEISTNGRKALRGVGLVLGAVTGQPVLSSGMTALNIALVDRSGAVLWYKIAGDSGGFDLRDAGSAKAFVQRLVSDFPAVGR